MIWYDVVVCHGYARTWLAGSQGGWLVCPAGAVHDHFIWSEEDELGRGSFGRVFRGKSCYDSKKFVAIKQMARSSIGDVDQLWSEINILADLDHPNILRFLEAYEDRCSFYIVTYLQYARE